MLSTISIFKKLKRYQRPEIKDNDHLVHCYDVSKTSVTLIWTRRGLRRPDVNETLMERRYDIPWWMG